MRSENKTDITPRTKLTDLLQAYPQLETVLLEMSPVFGKLKNPILRKTIAKAATLRQIAVVGNVDLTDLINQLRLQVGLPNNFADDQILKSEESSIPAWFDGKMVKNILDIRPILDAGEEPIKMVIKFLDSMGSDIILLVLAPFKPEPLIDLARKKGFQVWVIQDSPDVVKVYFKRA